MKLTVVIMAMLASSMVVNAEKKYNILSIDGGGIRGVLPAGILLKIEGFIQKYGKEKGYAIKEYDWPNPMTGETEKKIHLKDYFDLMAGTSTGSIISAALAYPLPEDKNKSAAEQMPQYFMQDILDIYTKEGNRIFVSYSHGFFNNFLIFLFFVCSCAAFGWYRGKSRFDNENEKKEMQVM